MTEEGWLTMGAEGSRGRKEYEITDTGRTELRRWLVDVTPERVGRNEWLLRIFFLWTLSPEEAGQIRSGRDATTLGEQTRVTQRRG